MPRCIDGPDTPLHRVTFCVVDLETTGGAPASCEITEVGAARFRGGECTGTFRTFVDPGAPVDPGVSALTGITDAMLADAPPRAAVLGALTEFIGGAVLVGHNIGFDRSFLDAALAADGRAAIDRPTVDTLALARRLVRDEAPDLRLGTLARHFGLDHRPTHRALDDVLATADLLHLLLERASAYGVTLLDDLLALPQLAAHPRADKLRLTTRVPRGPGAYVLRDGQGAALDVGWSGDDVRATVRALFSGDDERVSGPLLREVHAIDHVACAHALDAEVTAIRLGHALRPRRSRRHAGALRHRYVRLGPGARPRLVVTRSPSPPGRLLGPLPSPAAARAVVDAVALAVDLDVAGAHPGDTAGTAAGPCGADAGGAAEPGGTNADDAAGPGGRRRAAVADLFDDPGMLLSLLTGHARRAGAGGDPARAAALQRAADVLVDAVDAQRRRDRMAAADRIVVHLPGTAAGTDAGGDGADGNGATPATCVEIRRGLLVRPADARAGAGAGAHAEPGAGAGGGGEGRAGSSGVDAPALGPDLADEVGCTAAWLDRVARDQAGARLVHVDGCLASAVPGLPPLPAPGPP